MALDRKWRANVEHYGGRVRILTLTPPGEDVLPFGDDSRVIEGEVEPLVEWIYRTVWNATAQARASRLFEAAQRSADRHVRLLYGGALPRQIGNVRSEQKRGVWHFHWALPGETEVERVWSKRVERFMSLAWRQDQKRWPDEAVRRELLQREYAGEVTRGFYGFGFVKGGREDGASDRAARYMARNAAGYMAKNLAGVGRHYVSARLVKETGVTMAALRACNYIYVRSKLVERGELEDDVVPWWWSAEWREKVLRVWALVAAPSAP